MISFLVNHSIPIPVSLNVKKGREEVMLVPNNNKDSRIENKPMEYIRIRSRSLYCYYVLFFEVLVYYYYSYSTTETTTTTVHPSRIHYLILVTSISKLTLDHLGESMVDQHIE
jgi:hypothetical protein